MGLPFLEPSLPFMTFTAIILILLRFCYLYLMLVYTKYLFTIKKTRCNYLLLSLFDKFIEIDCKLTTIRMNFDFFRRVTTIKPQQLNGLRDSEVL